LTVINDILDFSKIESGMIELEEQDFNLHQCIEVIMDMFSATAAEKNLDLMYQIDPRVPVLITSDSHRLKQVLINLLVNAIDALKDRLDARISLSAYALADQKIIIKVADNGAGMSREVQEKIFIPFFSTKKQGSGIGLSLCKQIVMLHRGKIQVQSAEGVGTAFILRFG
ncbi:MAG: HAMP domain-containing histidine kinase, partial [Bacteroidetes bacterium]|nr:HAMP domain-containing histidine kinase [Bacteroidota bacterium]